MAHVGRGHVRNIFDTLRLALSGGVFERNAESMSIQYENAPITEALIDIRVELPPAVTLLDLAPIHEVVKERYPRKRNRIYVQGQLSVGDEIGVGATAKQTPMGFTLTSDDEKQVFQARLDGFTFSRLRPYGNWSELSSEARRLWGIYSRAVAPTRITRLAVRYINQIDVPQSLIEYKDYFRTVPEVSPDLPQGLSGFFMQLQFPQVDFGGTLILTQMSIQPPAEGFTSVVLDLDVFRENTEAKSDDDLWQLLEVLRNRKNEFFEGCLTEKSRELFGRKKEY